jgi:calcineurin-like phosphoesterase family protein
MANNIWFISDTHFQHQNILTFTNDKGERIRPKFEYSHEMDEYMIQKWNETVQPGDKIYHLGDFSFGNALIAERIIKRLHGKKRLVVGNHDKIKEVAPYFEKVYLWRIFKEYGFTCSHLPLRLDQLRKTPFNVHGHIHQNLMAEPQYINVCVEHHDYTPVHLDTLLKIIKGRQKLIENSRM